LEPFLAFPVSLPHTTSHLLYFTLLLSLSFSTRALAGIGIDSDGRAARSPQAETL